MQSRGLPALGCREIVRQPPEVPARLVKQTTSFRGAMSSHDEDRGPPHCVQGQHSEGHSPAFLGVVNPTMQVVGPGPHLSSVEELPIDEQSLSNEVLKGNRRLTMF